MTPLVTPRTVHTKPPEIEIMNAIKKSLAAVAVAAFGVALAPSADARSNSPWAGKPHDPATASCFSESRGAVTNNGSCGTGALEWIMPLVIDEPGTYTISVNVNPGNLQTNVECAAFGFFQDPTIGNFATSGKLAAPPLANVAQTMTLSVAGGTAGGVASGGVLYLFCNLAGGLNGAPGGTINTVNWNQP
jgi:hypothetical protein